MKRVDDSTRATSVRGPQKLSRGWRQFDWHLAPHPVPALELLDGAPVLIGDVGHRESDVAERGGTVGVAHHALQDREPDTGPGHVGAERVAKPVRIGASDRVVATAVAKQAAQPSQGHRVATSGSLQDDEQPGRRTAGGALPTHVVGHRPSHDLRQRQDPLAVALAADAKLVVLDEYVTELELEDLCGAQPA